MITRRIMAEEFNGVMSRAEIIRELGKYSRKMMNGVNCSANNLLIISQLGVLAEHSFITSFTLFLIRVYPFNLCSKSYKPYNALQLG
jgi:hypothetical protein